MWTQLVDGFLTNLLQVVGFLRVKMTGKNDATLQYEKIFVCFYIRYKFCYHTNISQSMGGAEHLD